MKLILVYNADGGMIASLTDSLHKAVSPQAYPCNLCRITYGPVGMKTKWKRFVSNLACETTFLHRDEFKMRYPDINVLLPAIFAEDETGVRTLVPAAEINNIRDMVELENLLKRALAQNQGGAPLYRCPECGLQYRDRETAAQCEAWCKEHKSCNLEITRYAVKE